MSLLTELVILVGGVSMNMLRRWRWETQRVNNIKNPVAVRYGGVDFPEVNLWSKAGLPESPFRTDSFPMITAPK
jgi:hypothetical protein